ncbi:MAG: GGDEF domain-containing phosphodiesterase, partial [Gammaproteobacteria bacterium]|nr:GGDEF domain-containing phosphodiesterase [Gammaproteobacteria bacterium]
ETAFLLIDIAEQQRVASVLGDKRRDDLVKTIAERLENFTRSSELFCALPDPDGKLNPAHNTVAVLGPHRFAVLLADVDSNRDVAAVCERIVDVLSHPVTVGEEELYPKPAIGIAVAPVDGDEFESLHQHSLAALTEQLDRQQAGFQWFSHDQDMAVRKRLSLEQDLRRAVDREEIEVFYQPRIDSSTLTPCAFEALARWRRNGELISPVEFIPIAEETGVINEIGEFVLYDALRVLHDWQLRLFPQLRISVNVSGQQFKTSDLPKMCERALQVSGADPHSLELEITEGVLLDSTDEMMHYLNELRALGVGLALDDFGTGYSSLSYLSRLPMNVLKIDRTFVARLLEQQRSQAIIRASVTLANDLGMLVVAEGVETEDQLDWLRAAGCHELQGFYFSRPLPTEECEAWLIEHLPTPGSRAPESTTNPDPH